jgi:hypothetical protein
VDGTIFGRGVGRYGNVLLSRYGIREQIYMICLTLDVNREV